jgi:hypothetical protein
MTSEYAEERREKSGGKGLTQGHRGAEHRVSQRWSIPTRLRVKRGYRGRRGRTEGLGRGFTGLCLAKGFL